MFNCKEYFFIHQVQHGEELEQLKRDMAVVLQASLGAAPSPAKADDANVQQLKNRIHELEQETEEISRKYNEELKTERVDYHLYNIESEITYSAICHDPGTIKTEKISPPP